MKNGKKTSECPKAVFFKLRDELLPYIKKKTTIMRFSIDVEKQLGITLYYLSDEGRLRKTANAFGVSRSSVSIIIRRVTQVIAMFLSLIHI